MIIPKILIDKIYGDLTDISHVTSDKNVIGKVIEIKKFIDENVYNYDKELINVIKKMVYTRMKDTIYKEGDENKELYILYQTIKENRTNFNDALAKFENIQQKYNYRSGD